MKGNRVFVKLPSEYKFLLPDYEEYFDRPLMLKRGIYGMTHSGKFFYYDLRQFMDKFGLKFSMTEPSI